MVWRQENENNQEKLRKLLEQVHFDEDGDLVLSKSLIIAKSGDVIVRGDVQCFEPEMFLE